MKTATMTAVTKTFIGGLLAGLTRTDIVEHTNVREGFRCEKPVGGSPYEITEVRKFEIMPFAIGEAQQLSKIVHSGSVVVRLQQGGAVLKSLNNGNIVAKSGLVR